MQFNDLKTFWEYRTKAARLQLSYAEFTEFFKYCVEHEEHIKGLFNALTMDKLKQIIYVRPGDKKEAAVKQLYHSVLGAFHVKDEMISYTHDFSGSIKDQYKAALIAKIEAQTEEDYFAAIAAKEADKAEKEKALSNPETLDEFRVFIQTKGATELTTDQYKRYIFLLAESEQGVEERKKITSVPTVETGGVEMELKESEHTIKKIPIFVVQLKTRVERDIYQALNLRAKRLGGYYSSYSKGGAIPGFVFESKEAAENFIKTDQYITNEEAVKAREEKRELNRAETLEEKAAALSEKGNEILNAERKDNTHRRARMAANAEARGAHMVKIAKIIENIATGINNGTLKFLTRVNAVTQVEDLNGLLIRARYKRQQAEKIQGDSYKIPIDEQLIKYVSYPYPYFPNDRMLRDLNKLKDAPGRKLAAARIIKRVKAHEREKIEYSTFKEHDIEDLKIVFSDPYKDYNYYDTLMYVDDIKKFERLQKLGLTTPALLKAALFEFLALRPGSILTPEQEAKQKVKEIERQFIGKKIPGFFPTPVELAETVIDLAEIKPGNTILEPSAGLGHIAELIRAEYPENDLKLVEYNVSLAEALKQKGFEVDNSDFLQYKGGPFDKIIMNPPFENLQDIDHVRHAFDLLKPGGRLVAVMANNKQGERQKVKEFNDFVSEYGYSEKNPDGSFKSAFNPTGVNTITVVLDKPQEMIKQKEIKKETPPSSVETPKRERGKLGPVKELNINEIFTRPQDFQNRQEKFSQATFDKIVSEGYDRNQEPVYVWRDPADNKYYILSGHSRFSAAQFLHNRDNNLETIPVKEFTGTFDDAIEYATIRSNRESNKEGLKSDIAAYAKAVKAGYNKAELLKYFNPESYLEKLKNLSYLNPKGRFIELLDTPEAVSFPYLERNAVWAGQLRKQLPQLSDAHESEMFNYFYTQGTDALKLKRDAFFNLIDKKVNRIDFNSQEPLNLQKQVSTAGAVNPAFEHLRELQREMEERQTIINKNRDLIARARVEGRPEMIKKFEDEISGQTARIIDLATQIRKAESDIAALERSTMFDLFAQPEEPKPEPTPEPTQQSTEELIEALKLTYEINPDEQTKELIEALELTETI